MTSIFKRDDVWTGMLLGLIIPIIVYGILFLIYTFMDSIGLFSDIGFADNFRTRTLSLIAICSNLVLMQSYRRTYRNETIRGILVASMVLVIIWFVRYGLKILKF